MTNREKEWKSTAKVQIEANMDSDISNLNDDDSFLPIEEQEKEPLSEEEKKEVRKKLFFLLVVIIVVLLGLLIVLIFNPFDTNTSKKEKETENKEETPKSDNEKPVTELEDGDIPPANYEIKALEKEIINLKYDYYENDTLAIYKTGNMDIKNLTDKNKLFLVTKTNDFASLIKNKTTIEEACNSDIIIEQKAIDEILKNRFSTTVVNYDEFTYNFYTNDEYQKTIKFIYNGSNAYVGKCYNYTNQINTFTQQELQSATKDKTKLYIDVKVVFISENGVFKDPNFTTLITNQNQSFEQYIKNGSTYRYTYDISGSSYSLLNVSLLK
ncbi:MAG: hypothetical protein E7162_00920 [Firmicutes bacterium]|nr:hypothetical protein [Bacillota bacterium]